MRDQPGGDDTMLVGEPAIPDEDDWTAHVATKVLEKPTPLRPANVLSARARVSCRRRGDTISAPIPETFSCERARTASGGVTPHGAQVRRSTGSIMNPVSSRQTRWAPSRRSFFYRGPIPVDPLAHPTIVALLRARLGSLRAEATGAKQAPHVIRMVDDIEVMPDQVDDAPTRPQAGAIAGRFRPGHDQARQSTALRGAELRGSTRGGAGTQPVATVSSVHPLPSTDGAPIDTDAVGHDMNRDVTLEEFDRAESPPLELSRAPLWAHVAPPTGEHSLLGHYLGRTH